MPKPGIKAVWKILGGDQFTVIYEVPGDKHGLGKIVCVYSKEIILKSFTLIIFLNIFWKVNVRNFFVLICVQQRKLMAVNI